MSHQLFESGLSADPNRVADESPKSERTQCETGAIAISAAAPDNQVSCGSVDGHAGMQAAAERRRAAQPDYQQSGYQAPPAGIHFIKEISSSSGLKSRNSKNSLNFFSNSGVSWRSLLFGRIATYWAELMRRTLAPLRKIVARELEVFEFRRNSVHPQSFAIHDHMECGHVHTSLLWDIFDLLNAYTESPHVRAIRHRCQECLTLTAKKPVQSVTLAKVKVA